MRIHVFRGADALRCYWAMQQHSHIGLFEQRELPPNVSHRFVDAITIFYVGQRCAVFPPNFYTDRNRETKYRRNMAALLVN